MKTFINKFEIMRNAFLLFALFNISAVLLYSQTNTFPSIGKVGIGVTNPNYTLEVGGVGNGSGVLITTGDEAFVGWYDRILKGESNCWGWYAYNGTTYLYDSFNKKNSLSVSNNGKIGIGVSNPQWNFEVGGTGPGTGVIMATGDEAFVGWYDRTIKGVANSWGWYANNGTSFLYDSFNQKDRLTITNTGLIGMGTFTPEYKLDVVGTIRAHHLKLNLDKAADYVFASDYKLLTLSEVDKFIQENKHLPGVPSAAEFKKNGLEVSEMSNLMLQKMEEMTLYIISQDKKLKEQEVKYQELLQKVELLNN